MKSLMPLKIRLLPPLIWVAFLFNVHSLKAQTPLPQPDKYEPYYQTLIRATNDFYSKPHDEWAETNLLSSACEIYHKLVTWKDFKEDVRKTITQPGEIDALKRNFQEFAESFYDKEEVLLKEKGVNDPARCRILSAATYFKDSVTKETDIEKVWADFNEFGEQICDFSDQLLKKTLKQKQFNQAVRKAEGFLMFVVDVAAEAASITGGPPTIAAAAPFTGSSAYFGLQMMVQ